MCYMAKPRKSSKKPDTPIAREVPARALSHPTVGVRELRQNLSVYLDHVKHGVAYTVTEHGHAVAILRPMPRGSSVLDRLVAEGRATPPTRSIRDLAPPLDLKLEKPLSQILLEMRDEEPY